MKIFKVIAVTLILMQLSACKDHLPIEGTPDHYALHGVVNDGNTINEIKLIEAGANSPTPIHLRFPASSYVGVTTQGWGNYENSVKIQKGYATLAFTYGGFKNSKKLVKSDAKNTTKNIAIYYRVNSPMRPFSLNLGGTAKLYQREIKEWGLIENVRKRGEWIEGRYYYLPIDVSFHTKNASPVWMHCGAAGTVETGQIPGGCFGFFQKNNLSIEYSFNYELMPDWREVYIAVSEFTDSIIVQK